MEKTIKELHRFGAAIAFFSRIPVPKKINYEYSSNGEASKYLPIVGLIISLISAFIFFLLSNYFPKSVNLILYFILNALLTGLIHEDGFSDFLDGFGGGWNKTRILEIMKDSSIGVFGVIGLIFLYTLKFTLLLEIPNDIILSLFVISSVLSRANAVSLMYDMNYVRDENSKAGKMTKKMSAYELLFVIACGIILLLLLLFNFKLIILIIIALIFFRFLIKVYLTKWIGGYTGDCLGFIQQISEVIIYIIFLLEL